MLRYGTNKYSTVYEKCVHPQRMSQMNANSGDMCITNNKLHFQRDGVHIDPVAMSIVSPVRSVLCFTQ
jgi:hypothetical protein